jgi:hypothetical protein
MSFNNLPRAMAQAIIYAGDPAPVISDAVPPEMPANKSKRPYSAGEKRKEKKKNVIGPNPGSNRRPLTSSAIAPKWKTDQDSGPPPPLPMYLAHICLWAGCKSAQRSFLTSHDLDFHIQTYHMRQCPWPTCVIQRSFRRKSDLLRHMESVHSGVRRFICDVPCCYTAYSRKDKLTAHKRSLFQARHKSRSLDMNPKLVRFSSGPEKGNMLPMSQGPTSTGQ